MLLLIFSSLFILAEGELTDNYQLFEVYVTVPQKGDFYQLGESCLQVQLYPEIPGFCEGSPDCINLKAEEEEGHCKEDAFKCAGLSWRGTAYLGSQKGYTERADSTIEFWFRFKIYKYLPRGKYVVRAVLNAGWCGDNYFGEWIREGDYHKTENHFIYLSNPYDKVIRVQLENYKKYHCGNELCQLKKLCELNKFTNTKQCECPNRCSSIASYKPICGSNGITYENECKMKASDCFSGTVSKRHDGECKPIIQFNPVQEPKNYAGIVIALTLVGLFLVIFLSVCLLLIRRSMKLRAARYNASLVANAEPIAQTMVTETSQQTTAARPSENNQQQTPKHELTVDQKNGVMFVNMD